MDEERTAILGNDLFAKATNHLARRPGMNEVRPFPIIEAAAVREGFLKLKWMEARWAEIGN
jgi:hypothetical protein